MTIGSLAFALGVSMTPARAAPDTANVVGAATRAVTVGTTFAHQAFTFGWLLAEVVRHVTGQSIGTFFRHEIAEPARPLALVC